MSEVCSQCGTVIDNPLDAYGVMGRAWCRECWYNDDPEKMYRAQEELWRYTVDTYNWMLGTLGEQEALDMLTRSRGGRHE